MREFTSIANRIQITRALTCAWSVALLGCAASSEPASPLVYPPEEFTGEEWDAWYERYSREVNRDLNAYFDAYRFPISADARARVAALGLAPWEWVPPTAASRGR